MSTITVALCTHDRATLLDGALASIAASDRPASCELQVVVVLNACSDDSAEVAARYARDLPLTLVTQPKAGLSHARNTAVANAAGDFIVWTDDDVRVHPGWLRAYERAMERNPDAAVFGGTIVPVFEGGPPDWLREALPLCEAAFAAQRPTREDAPILLASGVLPYGANFAIRADQQRCRCYDPRLGRRPGPALIGGEEAVVIRSVLDAGESGYWVPEAIVEHRIAPERQTVAYLRAYFEGVAFVKSLLRADVDAGCAAFLEGLREGISTELAYRRARRHEPPTVWVSALVAAATARGRVRGRIARSRRGVARAAGRAQ